jgi:hypothetical protein
MKHINNMIGLVLGLLMLSAATWQADAAQIQLGANSINMFRDSRGDNDVGLAPGERLQFGANVLGGSDGATLGAVYSPTGNPADCPQTPGCFSPSTPAPQVPCDPLAVNLNFCSRSVNFNLNRLAQPWTFRFEKSGFDPLTVTGPPLLGLPINGNNILDPVPHPTNVMISGAGVTPTIKWTIPNSFVPDGFRVQIYSKAPDGSTDIIHSVAVPVTSNSYQIPAVLNNVLGISIAPNGFYSINFQLVETRGHVVFTNNNAQILRRSSSFFNFTPLDNSAPPDVFLPTVSTNGSFHFTIDSVGPDSVTFIDPPVAVGYDYATGQGDPNFKSVLLPEVGDNVFDLYLWNGSEYRYHVSVGAGFNYTFPPGVDRFRVLGIEIGAGLDPNNATAFITGLTFVSSGQFTGTMTPIVASDVITTEIKPGDGPNCVNPKSKGVVPFAILGGEFDVATINQSTLQVDDDIDAGTGGVAPAQLSIIDINGDGINDLVIQFNTQDLNKAGLLTDGRTVYITARLLDGKLLVGSDKIFLSSGPTCQ